MTPFKALYGREPPNLLDYLHNTVSNDVLDLVLQKQQQILKELKIHLKKSRTTMEKQAILNHDHAIFYEGYLVLFKLQPYDHSIVNLRESKKLAKKYFGHFRIIKRARISHHFHEST